MSSTRESDVEGAEHLKLILGSGKFQHAIVAMGSRGSELDRSLEIGIEHLRVQWLDESSTCALNLRTDVLVRLDCFNKIP